MIGTNILSDVCVGVGLPRVNGSTGVCGVRAPCSEKTIGGHVSNKFQRVFDRGVRDRGTCLRDVLKLSVGELVRVDLAIRTFEGRAQV